MNKFQWALLAALIAVLAHAGVAHSKDFSRVVSTEQVAELLRSGAATASESNASVALFGCHGLTEAEEKVCLNEVIKDHQNSAAAKKANEILSFRFWQSYSRLFQHPLYD